MSESQLTAYQFVDVRNEMTDDLKAQIIQFWVDEGALKRERAAARVHQVLQVIQTKDSGDIAGICTGEIGYVGMLNHYFYNYRSFIGKAHRSQGLVRHLCIDTFDKLNQDYISGKETRAIGVFMDIESEPLKQITPAVWPTTQFVYVGLTPHNTHLRVRYFDNAQISPVKFKENQLPFGI